MIDVTECNEVLLSDISVTSVTVTSDSVIKFLNKRNINTIFDFLLYLPRRYENKALITPINELSVGKKFVISGKIILIKCIHGKKERLRCSLQDNTGIVGITFFHPSKFKFTLNQTITVMAKLVSMENISNLRTQKF